MTSHKKRLRRIHRRRAIAFNRYRWLYYYALKQLEKKGIEFTENDIHQTIFLVDMEHYKNIGWPITRYGCWRKADPPQDVEFVVY